MQKLFLRGLGITLLLNLLVKPATIFLVDIQMQNILKAESYGSFQTVLNFTFLFSMVLDMGITNFMTKLIAQSPQLILKYADRLFTVRLILIVVYIIWSLALYFILQLPVQWLWILGLLMLHQINVITVNYVRAYTGGLFRFGIDAVLSVMERSVYFVLGFLLLYTQLVPKEEISLAWFIGIFVSSSTLGLLFSAFVYVRIVKKPRFSWDKKLLITILKKSFPYALLVILMMLTMRIDAVLLKKLHVDGTKQVAYYTQSFRLLDACWMFAVLFGSILLPVFSKVLKEKSSTTSITTSALNLLVSGGLIMFAVTVGTKEILFPILYKDANEFSFNSWVFHAASFVPMCFTVVFGTLLTANGSLGRLNLIAGVSLVIMFVANLFLTPIFGAVGTACSFFIAQTVSGFWQYFEVRYTMKHRLAKYNWWKLSALFFALMFTMYVHKIMQFSLIQYYLICFAVWAVFVFGLRIIDLRLLGKLLPSKEKVD